ncbi:TIGR00645 family protein [Hyphomonas sp.]|uniref:TIGR00645 family protein n=1 Tax=Hyphomonas sp. TaxID=87 RepID=UPI00391D0E59
MSQTPLPPQDRDPLVERVIEQLIFSSRWLMAPIYLGLIAALGILIVTFFRELAHALPGVMSMEESDIILLILTLVDISLAGNLVLIIVFSGYENFVSKIGPAEHRDRPSWMGKVDFSGLKSKLIASIVAISAIHLLKIFMDLSKYSQQDLLWYTVIHLSFVVSGIGFAVMDWIDSRSKD